MVQVVLDGINNILKMAGEEVEPVCHVIEECGGTLRHRVMARIEPQLYEELDM